DDIIAWYRDGGVARFVIQINPARATATSLLESRGYRSVSSWSKLWRRVGGERLTTANTDVIVKEIGADAAQTYEQLVAEPLGVPPGLGAGVRSTIGKAGWRFYLAFLDDRPIAGAAYFRCGAGAWFGLCATQARTRGHGAQTALVARRMLDAAADG